MVTHFTCIGKGHGAPAVPATREDWERVRRSSCLADMCKRIEAGAEKLKNRLPIWTPHCAAFRKNHRAIADALQPLQRLMLDFDEKGHSQEILTAALALQESGTWQVLLVEESVRRGTHVLIALPEGMSAEEAQVRFGEAVGFRADAAVKDVSRCIYMVPESHTLYVHDSLFTPVPLQPAASEEAPSFPPVPATEPEEATPPVTSFQPAGTYPESYEEVPYSLLVEALEEQMGGTPEHGSRNNFIFSMACHLRYVCNDDPFWLMQVLPTYGEAREKWMTTIKSACARYQAKTMPSILQRALAVCKEKIRYEKGDQEGKYPLPPLPRLLPPLIKLLVSKTPILYRPAVAQAVFPALAAHLWNTTFRYIDNVAHEATLMNVLMAGTGAGKNCISEPINRILADIRQRDRVNREREKEWKQEVQSKGANKDKRKRPAGLVIQEVDPDMTNAALVQRLADAEGRFLYAKMNEIDQFDALKTSSRSKSHFQIMCLAFDPGNVYGQTRVGAGSVSERVCIRFNWNASTTIQKGQSYFRSVLTDGPISRINFCTIPERPIGSEMPIYGSYDETFDAELSPYIERLNEAEGTIDCPQARRLAQALVEESAEFARLSQSRVYENLSFRANVIAYLKACVLYVAQGYRWDKRIEDFVRWSLRYDLACKMMFFGEAIEEIERRGSQAVSRGPRNLLELLPIRFTAEEARQLRQREGIIGGSLAIMLNNWKQRGYIECTDEKPERYMKTEAYLKRHPQKPLDAAQEET